MLTEIAKTRCSSQDPAIQWRSAGWPAILAEQNLNLRCSFPQLSNKSNASLLLLRLRSFTTCGGAVASGPSPLTPTPNHSLERWLHPWLHHLSFASHTFTTHLHIFTFRLNRYKAQFLFTDCRMANSVGRIFPTAAGDPRNCRVCFVDVAAVRLEAPIAIFTFFLFMSKVRSAADAVMKMPNSLLRSLRCRFWLYAPSCAQYKKNWFLRCTRECLILSKPVIYAGHIENATQNMHRCCWEKRSKARIVLLLKLFLENYFS